MSESEAESNWPPIAALFESSPTAVLAAMAAAAGVIAVATIGIEILTFRYPARVLGFQTGFVSLPLGAAAPMLAALTARTNVRFSLPAVGLSIVYWGLFLGFM